MHNDLLLITFHPVGDSPTMPESVNAKLFNPAL